MGAAHGHGYAFFSDLDFTKSVYDGNLFETVLPLHVLRDRVERFQGEGRISRVRESRNRSMIKVIASSPEEEDIGACGRSASEVQV